MSDYRDQRVIITGASSGIGLALAGQFAEAGAELVLVARDAERLAQAQAQILAARPEARVSLCAMDIGSARSVRDGGPALTAGPVDVLINNAGIAACDEFEALSDEAFERLIETDYLGQVRVTRLVLPLMRRQGAGLIVNVGSMAGGLPVYGYTAYAAAKAALAAFSRALRNELASTGIDVTLVLPSDVSTPQYMAENRTKPAVTRAIAGTIRPLTAGEAARQIMRGIRRRRAEVVVAPLGGRVLYWLTQHFPATTWRVLDKLSGHYRR